MELNTLLGVFGTYGPLGVILGVFIYWHNKNLIQTQNEYKQPVQAILQEIESLSVRFDEMEEKFSEVGEKVVKGYEGTGDTLKLQSETLSKLISTVDANTDTLRIYQDDMDKLLFLSDEKSRM